MWTKLSDEFFRNPKVVAAGRDARDLYLVSLCHCNEHLTDGFIAQNYLRRMAADAEIDNPVESASRLVEVRLWDVVPGGYLVHDFGEYNPTKSEVEQERKEKAARQEKWRQSRNASRNASHDTSQVASQDGAPVPVPVPVPVIPSVLVTPLIPQGGAVAVEAVVMPMSNEGDTEPDTDAFTPAELHSEPLPAPASRRQQASEKQRTDEKRTAIMQAYRAVRFDRPLTDSIPEAEFNRMKGHADSLIAMGVRPEQVGAATDEALNRTEAKYVTLGYLAGHWTEITTPLPAPRPSAMAGPVRLTAAEQRDLRQKAERDAEYEQLAQIERELYGEGAKAPVPLESSGSRVVVRDDAFARPPRRMLDSVSARRVVQ